jgi:hypothetical protein
VVVVAQVPPLPALMERALGLQVQHLPALAAASAPSRLLSGRGPSNSSSTEHLKMAAWRALINKDPSRIIIACVDNHMQPEVQASGGHHLHD